MIIIYTDGSSRGNPGPGGWGAIVASEDKVKEIGGREAETTNNRMEMTACIKALELIEAKDQATIFCDSAYVVKGITEWIFGWQKNNWKTANKKPVENQDLWLELLKATEGKNLEWRIIPGHAGIQGNERCDEIATSFADEKKIHLYEGDRNKYQIKL